MKSAVYPGTFDPVTLGHAHIIERAARLCDRLTVTVMINPQKTCMFNLDTRISMLKKTVQSYGNVNVDSYEGLLADYLDRIGAEAVIRGLRYGDFDFEYQSAMLNKSINPRCETVSLFTDPQYAHISSTAVRNLLFFSGDIASMVPGCVVEDLYSCRQAI